MNKADKLMKRWPSMEPTLCMHTPLRQALFRTSGIVKKVVAHKNQDTSGMALTEI